MACSCCNHEHHNHQHSDNDEISEGGKLVVSLLSLVCSFLIQQFKIQLPFYPISDPAWIAVWLCAIPIYKEAFFAIFKLRKINSPVLISTAMTGAFVLQILALNGYSAASHLEESYVFVVGEIAFLMGLGEWIENKTVSKAQSAIVSLSKLLPKRALKKIGDKYEDVCVSTIEPNDTLVVKPNEVIPVDGKIIKGFTSINESTMTGESLPVDKTIGDVVFGGTQNESGYIEILATQRTKDSAISRLTKVVEEARGQKAPISRIADRWASYIVPAALVCSVLIFFVAKYLLGVETLEALVRAVTILIVFCPCAFVLATPTAIAAGLGNLAKRGVLVKSGSAIETLANVNTVFFDKTGTLTKGEISVEKIYPKGISEKELLKITACAEKFSEHPIAKSILKYAEDKVDVPTPEKITSLAGIGVECEIGSDKILVEKFREKINDDEISKSIRNGKSIIKVTLNDRIVGYIALSDTIRESAKEAIVLLKKVPCKITMLTGDAYGTAESIGKIVGIDDIRSELMPTEKLSILKTAHNKGEITCMVGDGVNDTPALAESDVSIAISDLKNELATNISDVSLIGGDLRKISQSIEFGKIIMRTIKVNMIFSLIINAAAVALTITGILTPVWGALWHNASSIIVVVNSARLTKSKR